MSSHQSGLFPERLYMISSRNSYRDIEIGAYLIDQDVIVKYDLCVTQQEHMTEYIDNPRWTFLGYGYCVNTTLLNEVSANTDVSAFLLEMVDKKRILL